MRGISIIILLGLIPPALGQAAGAPPVIHFTIYAPPQQPPPPIDAPERKAPAHIVGFENDRNGSDKPVIGVAIATLARRQRNAGRSPELGDQVRTAVGSAAFWCG